MTKYRRIKSKQNNRNIQNTSADAGDAVQTDVISQRTQALQISPSSTSSLTRAPVRSSASKPTAAIHSPTIKEESSAIEEITGIEKESLKALKVAVSLFHFKVPDFKESTQRLDILENVSAIDTYSIISRIIDESRLVNAESRREIITDPELLALLKNRMDQSEMLLNTFSVSWFQDDYLKNLSAAELKREFIEFSETNDFRFEAHRGAIKYASLMYKLDTAYLKDLKGSVTSPVLVAETHWSALVINEVRFLEGLHSQDFMKKAHIELKDSPFSKNLESLSVCLKALNSIFIANETIADMLCWVRHAKPALNDLAEIALDMNSVLNNMESLSTSTDKSDLDIQFFKAYSDTFSMFTSDILELLDFQAENHAYFEHERAQAALAVGGASRGGKLISVLDPSGIYILAMADQEKKAAPSSPSGNLNLGRVDADFHSASNELADADDVDDESIEDAENNQQAEPAPSRREQQLTKLMRAGQNILDRDNNKDLCFQKQDWKTNSPQIVQAHYEFADRSLRDALERTSQTVLRIKNKLGSADQSQTGLAAAKMLRALEEKAVEIEGLLDFICNPDNRLSMMKGFHRPQANHLAELLQKGEVSHVSPPVPLASTPPNTLFEIRIEHKPDADGTQHPPVWLHLHSHTPIEIDLLRNTVHSDFTAIHLKSDEDKNRGAEWVASRKQRGLRETVVHRSPVNAELFRQVMEKAFESN